jgi:hypothetical protein
MPSRSARPRVRSLGVERSSELAELNWPQLGEVVVRWRGGYGYVIGHLDTDDDQDIDEPDIPLCRLGYLGADDDWAFALYDPATDTYQDTVLPNGSFTGTPKKPSTAPAKSTWPTHQTTQPNPDRTSAGLH